MNRCSIGAAVVFLALSAASLPACVNGDVQLGGADDGVSEWEGYTVNYEFPSGSDKVVIHFTGKTGDAVTGTMQFGEGPDLPPPTGAKTQYPPGVTSSFGGLPLIEGFEFQLVDATLTSDRLKGKILLSDPWSAWCELQTPHEQSAFPGHYSCVPNMEMAVIDGECVDSGIAFDCNQYWLCDIDYACHCDADKCEAGRTQTAQLDFEIDGDKARGVVTVLGGNDVRLTRVSGP